MEDGSAERGRLTIGLDLGDRYSHLCVMNSGGDVEEEGRVATTREALRRRFGSCERVRVALEVGTHSPWVSRLLKECGHEVLVANPSKLRMIYENDNKDDRVDAEWLARIARMDPQLLKPIQHRGVEAQADLAVVRARSSLVCSRTQLVNHVRGAVKAFGGRVPRCSTESFAKRAVAYIPEPLQEALSPVLQTIATLTQQIRDYDRRVEAMAENRYPDAKLLQQVGGVGPLTAVTYILTIEDPHRFKKSRALGPYLGLKPRKDKSGELDPQLRITKAGDMALRSLLVGSAHYILGPFGPDCDLRRKGLAMAERGGKNAKKRAVVAVARKLAVLLHRLWITGEVYEPLRSSTTARRSQSVPA